MDAVTEELSLNQKLMAAGFQPCKIGEPGGDYTLQDDSDGRGPYIREWLSKAKCPFPELVRKPDGAPG